MSEDLELRPWQIRARDQYWQRPDPDEDFLVVATPGAGKTRWTLYITRQLIDAGWVKRFVVVVPTTTLKKQWAEVALDFQLDLDEGWSNAVGKWPEDADGVVMTYSQVYASPDLHRLNVSREPTLVILDEVHHLEEEAAWGEAAKTAFEPAVRRVSLSGTPWRRQGAIPWITYDESGIADASFPHGFRFTYADSVREDCCCPVYFPHYEGAATWEAGGERHTADFTEKLNPKDDSYRRRTIMDPKRSEYLHRTILEADRELSATRAVIPHAAGIVLAKDQPTARMLTDLMEAWLGRRPTLVISDDPQAKLAIHSFRDSRDSRDRWIVAVKMISEGVDIPRLRVLVWATPHCKSRLAFDQGIGRIVRGPTPPATVFIPDVEPLLTFAREMMAERNEALRDVPDIRCPGPEREWEPEPDDFMAVGTESAFGGVIHPGGSITQQEFDEMRKTLPEGFTTPQVTVVAELWKRRGEAPSSAPSNGSPFTHRPTTQRERKEALKHAMRKIITNWAYQQSEDADRRQALIKDAQTRLNRAVGVKGVREATLEQLKQRDELTRQWYGRPQ
jgi:superfamily II DNA or RNA helicase